MRCKIDLRKGAKKFLENHPDIINRIEDRLRELSERPICDEKVKGIQDLCKTRVGPYRIAYSIKPCNIVVIAIGRRESFYDELRHIS